MAFLNGDAGAPWLPLLTARLFALEAVDVETEAPVGDCETRGDTAMVEALGSWFSQREEIKSFCHTASHIIEGKPRSSLVKEIRRDIA